MDRSVSEPPFIYLSMYDTLNQGGYIYTDVTIVMDFSKALDKVDHQRLLLKLHRLGIKTTVIAWIKSFLSGRSQSVVLDGEQYGACPVLSIPGKRNASIK